MNVLSCTSPLIVTRSNCMSRKTTQNLIFWNHILNYIYGKICSFYVDSGYTLCPCGLSLATTFSPSPSPFLSPSSAFDQLKPPKKNHVRSKNRNHNKQRRTAAVAHNNFFAGCIFISENYTTCGHSNERKFGEIKRKSLLYLFDWPLNRALTNTNWWEKN